jgi:hypothetical protein
MPTLARRRQCRTVWSRLGVPKVVRVASDAVVGRDDELSSALDVLRRLRSGHPGVVIVSGSAGIGKDSILHKLGVNSTHRGGRYGPAPRHDPGLKPWLAALRRYVV